LHNPTKSQHEAGLKKCRSRKCATRIGIGIGIGIGISIGLTW